VDTPGSLQRIGVMQESFGSSLGGRSRRAKDGDDDELDLHGYTMGTHEPRMRPIRTNAHSHTEAREFGTPVDCQHRSTTADAPSGGGSAGSNPVGGTTLQIPYFVAGRRFWTHSMITKSTAGTHRVHIRIKLARLFPYSRRRGGLLFESRRPAPQLLVRVSIAARERRISST